MKKYFYRFAAMGIAILIMTSCGGNNKGESSNEDNQENVPEIEVADATVEETPVEPEDNTIKPPFTIVAEQNGKFMNGLTRTTLTLTFQKNGMVEGTKKLEWKWNDTDEWVEPGAGYDALEEYNGKWTTTYREVGEENQKVYRTGSGEIGYFVPDDAEYVYYTWDACSNFWKDPKYLGYEVKEVKKL